MFHLPARQFSSETRFQETLSFTLSITTEVGERFPEIHPLLWRPETFRLIHQSFILDTLRTDLAELTALHAPSGAEQPVIARLRELFAPLVDEVSVDHMGNLTATREGPQGSPHIVVSAHADEIGAMVACIEPEVFIRLFPLGS